MAITPNGRFACTGNLATSNARSYRIDRSGRIGADGTLDTLGAATGLPAGFAGLAAN